MGTLSSPRLGAFLCIELWPPSFFVYCLGANFWGLQFCSPSQLIWINFARSGFELLWSRLSHLVIFSSAVFVMLLKSYHVCGLWLVLFYNPGVMQSHNSFVFLGCVQFVNLYCRRAIQRVRHGPCQSEAETGVESQLRPWVAVVPGQFASPSRDLASCSGKWEEARPGL